MHADLVWLCPDPVRPMRVYASVWGECVCSWVWSVVPSRRSMERPDQHAMPRTRLGRGDMRRQRGSGANGDGGEVAPQGKNEGFDLASGASSGCFDCRFVLEEEFSGVGVSVILRENGRVESWWPL